MILLAKPGDKVMFAKLFEDEEYGQILIKIDRDNDNGDPEVRFFSEPFKELGVCSFALGFDDTDRGWEKAQKLFNQIDSDRAKDYAETIVTQIQGVADMLDTEEDVCHGSEKLHQ